MKYKIRIIITFLLIMIFLIILVFNEKIELFYSSIFFFQVNSFKLPVIQLFISIIFLILKMLTILLVIDFEFKLMKMIKCRISDRNYKMLLIKNFLIVISIITLLNIFILINVNLNHPWIYLISDISCLFFVGLIHIYISKANYVILTLIMGITSIIVNNGLMFMMKI